MSIAQIANGESKASVRAKLNLTIDEANRVEAIVGVVSDAPARPGDSKLASTVTSGTTATALASLVDTDQIVNDTDLGACIRVQGSDVPASPGWTNIGRVDPIAVRVPGDGTRARIYKGTWTLKRTVDAGDPVNDTVQCAVQYLAYDKSLISLIAAYQDVPTVAEGVITVEATFSFEADDDTDYVIPATTRYIRPYVRIYGTTATTLVSLLELVDITDSAVVALDISGKAEKATAITRSGLVTGTGDDLSDDFTINVTAAGSTVGLAGTSTTTAMTPADAKTAIEARVERREAEAISAAFDAGGGNLIAYSDGTLFHPGNDGVRCRTGLGKILAGSASRLAMVVHLLGYGQSTRAGSQARPIISYDERAPYLMFEGGNRPHFGDGDYDSLVPATEIGPTLGEATIVGETPNRGMMEGFDDACRAYLGYGVADMGVTLLASDASQGETGSTALLPGGSYYGRLTTSIQSGHDLAQTDRDGSYALAALTVMHGENDILDDVSAATHQANWRTIRARVETDYRTEMGDPSLRVPAILTQVSSHSTVKAGGTTVTALAQADLCNDDPEVNDGSADFIMGLPLYWCDFKADPTSSGLHLKPLYSKWVGFYFGLIAFRLAHREALRARGEDVWKRFRPLGHRRDGKLIIVSMSVPKAPMVLDTDWVDDPGDYGFAAVTSGDDAVALANVTISGNDLVFEFADETAAGTVARISYASSGGSTTTAAGRLTGDRGCLRDSSGDYLFDPEGLRLKAWRWCEIFDLDVSGTGLHHARADRTDIPALIAPAGLKPRLAPATIVPGATTAVATAGGLRCFPVLVPDRYEPETVQIEVTTGTSSDVRIGLYEHDPVRNAPGRLIEQSSEIDCTSAAVKTWTLAEPLRGHRQVWIGLCFEGTPTIRAGTASSAGYLGWTDLTTAATALLYAQSYGALPANLNATTPTLSTATALINLYQV